MKIGFTSITSHYTQESFQGTFNHYIKLFKGSSVAAFTAFKNILNFTTLTPTTSNELKETLKYNGISKSISKEAYQDVRNIKVPTIIGLVTTLPALVDTLETNMTFIDNGVKIKTILASVRMFLTKPDHRMDMSRNITDIEKSTEDLKKRIERLASHFDMDVVTDTNTFGKLFGNINTYKSSGIKLRDMSILTNGTLLTDVNEQYDYINNYVDELIKISLNDTENVLTENINILVSELEYCANYFTFASQIISLSQTANDIYINVTKEIK